jgi:hypothetical protein
MKNLVDIMSFIIKIEKRENLYALIFSLLIMLFGCFYYKNEIFKDLTLESLSLYIVIGTLVLTSIVLFFIFKALIKDLIIPITSNLKARYKKVVNISKLSKEANALYVHLKKEGKYKYNITEQQLKTTYCYYLEKNPQDINELTEIDHEIKSDDLEALKRLKEQLNVHNEENKKIYDFVNAMNNHQDIKVISKKNEYITKHEKSFKNAYVELKLLNLIKMEKIDGENIIFLI